MGLKYDKARFFLLIELRKNFEILSGGGEEGDIIIKR